MCAFLYFTVMFAFCMYFIVLCWNLSKNTVKQKKTQYSIMLQAGLWQPTSFNKIMVTKICCLSPVDLILFAPFLVHTQQTQFPYCVLQCPFQVSVGVVPIYSSDISPWWMIRGSHVKKMYITQYTFFLLHPTLWNSTALCAIPSSKPQRIPPKWRPK